MKKLDVSSFDTGSLKDMSHMFDDCRHIKTFKGVKYLTAKARLKNR